MQETSNKPRQTDKGKLSAFGIRKGASVEAIAVFTSNLIAAGVLAGCCAFGPCHPATLLTGRVTSVDGAPISGASVHLYGMTSSTDAQGCFRLGGLDAIPFELDVEAAGYKPIRDEARPGSFQLEVRLASDDSQEQSTVQWHAVRTYPSPDVAGCT